MSDGYDRLGERAYSYGDKQAAKFANHPVLHSLKWLLGIVGVFIVIGGALSLIGLATGYWDDGKDIVSSQNRKTQSYNVRQNWGSLLTAAQNACSANAQASTGNGQPQLVENPAQAYASTYRNIRTNYNRAQDNPYENGVINASGYPKHVPIFPEEAKIPTNWCSVVVKLENMHN